MSLTQVQDKILGPFVRQSVECLKSMAGLKASAGDTYQDDMESFWLNDYAVAVETSGAIEGTVLIHIYLETALAVGKKVHENLLGEEIDETMDVDEDIIDSLREFGNTIVGLATRELSQSDLCVVFEPPMFVTDMEEQSEILFDGVKEVMSVPIDIDGVGKFYLNYLLKGEKEIQ